MKHSNNQTDVIELEAEEIPLETKIENELVKANVTDAVITELEKIYSGLVLRSIDDKENYLIIKEARKNVRAVEIIVEKVCKHGREDAIKEQKLWLAKEKFHLERTGKVKNPLEAEIKKFDDEVERKELEEKQRKEAAYMQRQSALIKYGATYTPVDGGSFVLNHISYEVALIKDSDEEVWQEIILPKYKAEFEKIEAVRVEEENKRKAEMEAMQKQREEIERQTRELTEARAALQKQTDEANRQQQAADQQKQDELLRQKRERINNRSDQLMSLGMKFSFQYDAHVLEDVNVDNKTELCLFNDAEWNALIEKITPVIEERKKAIEEKIIADAEVKKQKDIEAALEKERQRVAEEKRLQEVKEKQEAEHKAEELAKASDKQKWDMWIDVVKQLLPPTTMRSTIYKSKSQTAQQKLNEIINL